MSNSSLVSYTLISPNKNVGNYKKDTVTIHCMAGQLTVEQCGKLFANKSRQASSNYGIGYDGRIGLYVEEKDRSWATSSKANDIRAITIEVANCALGGDWPMSAAAINSLVLLMTDICQRNGIPMLKWSANKFLAGTPEQNVAAHRWFARKTCPGNFLYDNMGAVVDTVNLMLSAGHSPEPAPVISDDGYFINGLDFSPVFDPAYYSEHNLDVAANPYYGTSNDMLWQHFCDFGMNELRQGSAEFNAKAYKERYSDLREAFGDDNFLYYQHYIMFGKAEGRTAV